MKKFTYETPEIEIELVEEDIITDSLFEKETILGEEINPE